MSGEKPVDRRARKTHAALIGAFNELFLERRYDEIQVGDIVKDADVGRSTFYEHYRDKDDLLVQSMAGMLHVLADAAVEEGDGLALEHVVAHFWQNRERGRYLLAGPPSRHVFPRLSRELAERIEQRLEARVRQRGGTPVLPLRLIAIQVAEAQFALIRAWLQGRAACSPEQFAAGLRRSSVGSISALM